MNWVSRNGAANYNIILIRKMGFTYDGLTHHGSPGTKYVVKRGEGGGGGCLHFYWDPETEMHIECLQERTVHRVKLTAIIAGNSA
jgi:hypothetical protein